MTNDHNKFNVNINDVALIFEGGGMRASYTAGAVVTLLENNLNFGDVYGISAGSSHTVNYVSRDTVRAKMSFVDLVDDPEFGGLKTFVQGKGFFNAHHLYEGVAEDPDKYDSRFHFDWDTFCANPANVHIEALERDTGETVLWTKSDMRSAHEMMLRVRASSTMPIFMPPTVVEGHTYMGTAASGRAGAFRSKRRSAMAMSASSSCERRRRGIVNLLLGERGSCCSEVHSVSTQLFGRRRSSVRSTTTNFAMRSRSSSALARHTFSIPIR